MHLACCQAIFSCLDIRPINIAANGAGRQLAYQHKPPQGRIKSELFNWLKQIRLTMLQFIAILTQFYSSSREFIDTITLT